jgi:hypothetical protein
LRSAADEEGQQQREHAENREPGGRDGGQDERGGTIAGVGRGRWWIFRRLGRRSKGLDHWKSNGVRINRRVQIG